MIGVELPEPEPPLPVGVLPPELLPEEAVPLAFGLHLFAVSAVINADAAIEITSKR